VIALSVGLSVSLLETIVYFGRMAEATEMPFGLGWSSKKYVLNGVLIPPWKGAILEFHNGRPIVMNKEFVA